MYRLSFPQTHVSLCAPRLIKTISSSFMTQQRLTYKFSFPFLYYIKSTIRFCLACFLKVFLSSLYSHVC